MTPIALVKGGGHRVIFVCAAKHVGLQLARASISCDIPLAVAFGCKDPSDIRLHYFAAKDFVRNRYTGGIFHVDNGVGDKVELVISDVESYVHAMNYMLAFNEPEQMVLFWDEPTIYLDLPEHPHHAVLARNWQENEIPNVIFSSATLPRTAGLMNVMSSFKRKFSHAASTDILEINSSDFTKSIALLDTASQYILPHHVTTTHSDMKRAIDFLTENITLLRYASLPALVDTVLALSKHYEVRERYQVDHYFETLSDINSNRIKEYYLDLLGYLMKRVVKTEEEFTAFQEVCGQRSKMYPSTIKITTADAHTITNGPAIYLAEDVNKIGKFCLKIAKIPATLLENLQKTIKHNDIAIKKMEELEREKNKNKDGDDMGAKKDNDRWSKEKGLIQKINGLRESLVKVTMDENYIPNHRRHLQKWDTGKGACDEIDSINVPWTSQLGEEEVRNIMELHIAEEWKILLLMGIGVFTDTFVEDGDTAAATMNVRETEKSIKRYVEVMKHLAEERKLFMIIASTDYIYGTNYQFMHGYLGKDLTEMTQEKLIQALGRIGRTGTSMFKYSIRLRNNDLGRLLFMPSDNLIEEKNMNKIFSFSGEK